MDVFDALTPVAARRLCASTVGPFAQAYRDRLCRQRYAPRTVRLYLNCLAHFGHWARRRFEPASAEQHIERFVNRHLVRADAPGRCNELATPCKRRWLISRALSSPRAFLLTHRRPA